MAAGNRLEQRPARCRATACVLGGVVAPDGLDRRLMQSKYKQPFGRARLGQDILTQELISVYQRAVVSCSAESELSAAQCPGSNCSRSFAGLLDERALQLGKQAASPPWGRLT